jgi:predicted PurR-regulated permease PerM
MPPSLDRLMPYLKLAAYVVVIGAGIRAVSGILDSIFLAVTLTLAMMPLLQALHRRGLSNGAAMAVATLVMLIVVVGLLAFMGLATTSLVRTVPIYQAKVETLWQGLGATAQHYGVDLNKSLSGDLLNPSRIFSFAAGFLGSLGGVLSKAVLLLLIVAFILIEAGSRNTNLESAPRFSRIAQEVRQYLGITAISGFTFAILSYVLMLVVGTDLALVWAVLAFLMNFVPNVGFVLSLIPPMVLTFLEYGWQRAAVVAAGFVAMNFVLDNVIKPKFMKSGLDVSPLLGLLSLLVWSYLLGPMGALLAIPLTIVGRGLVVVSEEAEK